MTHVHVSGLAKVLLYHKHFPEYRDWLRTSSPYRIQTSRIREFVSQNMSDPGGRVYRSHFAVREARIYCPFPNKNVGQICLIDMPGLGDTGVGDEPRLLHALGQEVDFILLLRRASPMGEFWADYDVRLYDLCAQSLPDIPLEKWMFLILNRTLASSPYGDNINNIRLLKDSRGRHHINTAECLEVNCADFEDVNDQLILPLLRYLTDNIGDLDAIYASACQKRIDTLRNEIVKALSRAHGLLGNETGPVEEYRIFRKLFTQTWDDLTNGLEVLRTKLLMLRDAPDNTFSETIDRRLEEYRNCDAVPPPDEIERKSRNLGSKRTAADFYLDRMRTQIGLHFESLDETLKVQVDQAKQMVADVLCREGLLRNLFSDPEQATFATIYGMVKDDTPLLQNNMNQLLSFQLSYRGFIQHRIRLCLDVLTPDKTPYSVTSEDNAESIAAMLDVSRRKAIVMLEREFDEWRTSPNQAIFAVIEEFIDRTLRSEDSQEDWENFYLRLRNQIWPSQFALLGAKSDLQAEWKRVLSQVEDCIAYHKLTINA